MAANGRRRSLIVLSRGNFGHMNHFVDQNTTESIFAAWSYSSDHAERP